MNALRLLGLAPLALLLAACPGRTEPAVPQPLPQPDPPTGRVVVSAITPNLVSGGGVLLHGVYDLPAADQAVTWRVLSGGGRLVLTGHKNLVEYGAPQVTTDTSVVLEAASVSDPAKTATLHLTVRPVSLGELDPSFGKNGKVALDIPSTPDGLLYGGANALAGALSPDGQVVLAGQVWLPSGRYALAAARLGQNGTPDASFGRTGRTFATVGAGSAVSEAVLVQPDGKIVAVGRADRTESSLEGRDFALVRFLPDGALDPSFGGNGRVVSHFDRDDLALAAVLQPDGKIVVAGTTAQSEGPTPTADIAVARYNPDGSLDASFGSNGLTRTDFHGLDDVGEAVVLQPDGRIIVAGGTARQDGKRCFALARYNPDGSLDPSFGTGGKVVTDFGDSDGMAFGLAVQPDGRIVAAGWMATVGWPGQDMAHAVVRYSENGGLDQSFGAGGVVQLSLSSGWDYAQAVTVQPDGRIIVAGREVWSSYSRFAVLRLTADGQLDTLYRAEFAADSSEAHSVAVQPDGRIVAVGNANSQGHREDGFLAARFLP